MAATNCETKTEGGCHEWMLSRLIKQTWKTSGPLHFLGERRRALAEITEDFGEGAATTRPGKCCIICSDNTLLRIFTGVRGGDDLEQSFPNIPVPFLLIQFFIFPGKSFSRQLLPYPTARTRRRTTINSASFPNEPDLTDSKVSSPRRDAFDVEGTRPIKPFPGRILVRLNLITRDSLYGNRFCRSSRDNNNLVIFIMINTC